MVLLGSIVAPRVEQNQVLFYHKTLAFLHKKIYPEIYTCAPQHQKILPVLHQPPPPLPMSRSPQGVPLAATSLLSSSSTLRSRGGKSRPPQRRVCGFGPSPRAILLPDSRDAKDEVRIAPGSRRRGIAPTVGGVDALFAPALVLLPLLAMPPFDSLAAAAAATRTMIKNKGKGGSSGSLAAAWWCY